LHANEDHSSSTESLDLFGLEESNNHHSPNNNKKQQNSFAEIVPRGSSPKARRVVPKGAKQSRSYNDHELQKRARELEEIGMIGSSEEMHYDPNDDDDENDVTSSHQNSLMSMFRDDDSFEYFEDAEADSYYSEHSSDYDNDNDGFESPGSPQQRVPQQQQQPQPKFQRRYAPNHFAAFVDHGDWRVLGKNANKIRKRPPKKRIDEESESDSDESSSSSSSDSSRTNDNDTQSYGNSSVSQGAVPSEDDDSDDDSVVRTNNTDDDDDDKANTRRKLSRMSSFALRQWDGFRAQVQELVLPDQVDQVDTLLQQFAGREAELLQTLEKLQKVGRRTNHRAAVHRSRQLKTTRRAQTYQTTEAVAHIAAACTIDEGVNVDVDFWKEDVSVFSNDLGILDDGSSESYDSRVQDDQESYYSDEDGSSSGSAGSYYTKESAFDDGGSWSDEEEEQPPPRRRR